MHHLHLVFKKSKKTLIAGNESDLSNNYSIGGFGIFPGIRSKPNYSLLQKLP